MTGPLCFKAIYGVDGMKIASDDRGDQLPTPKDYFSAMRWEQRKKIVVQILKNTARTLQNTAALVVRTIPALLRFAVI